MNVTPKERRLAHVMASDTSAFEKRGALTAGRLILRAYKPILEDARRIYRSGGRSSILGDPGAILGPLRGHLLRAFRGAGDELASGMILAHLQGMRRSLESAVLSLSSSDRAVKALTAQLNLTPEQIGSLRERYHAEAFRVLANASDAVERKLQTAVLTSVERGEHVKDGVARLQKAFEDGGISPRNSFQLEAIFRTQLQTAYGAAKWEGEQDPALQAILWGYKYVTVGDDRVRPEHAGLEGTTLPKDNPIWDSIYPPNGWCCRCQAIPLYNERDQVPPPKVFHTTDDYGNPLSVVPGPDTGFTFNPGKVLADGQPAPKLKIRPRPVKKKPPVVPSVPEEPKQEKITPKLLRALEAKNVVADTKLALDKTLEEWKKFEAVEAEEGRKAEEAWKTLRETATKLYQPVTPLTEGERAKLEAEEERASATIEKVAQTKREALWGYDHVREEQALAVRRRVLAKNPLREEATVIKTDGAIDSLHGSMNANEIPLHALDGMERGKNEIHALLEDDVFESLGGKKVTLRYDVAVHDDDDRAFYLGQGKINMGAPRAGLVAVVPHEYGHALEEFNPKLKTAANRILSKRASEDGFKTKGLKEHYGPSSKYRPDEKFYLCSKQPFPDPYCSKVYSTGATEITSMGLQYMATDPLNFYQRDPEYFAYIVKVMKGAI
jgi:SPP1 gp7 family putative phage head morphogenesis protein